MLDFHIVFPSHMKRQMVFLLLHVPTTVPAATGRKGKESSANIWCLNILNCTSASQLLSLPILPVFLIDDRRIPYFFHYFLIAMQIVCQLQWLTFLGIFSPHHSRRLNLHENSPTSQLRVHVQRGHSRALVISSHLNSKSPAWTLRWWNEHDKKHCWDCRIRSSKKSVDGVNQMETTNAIVQSELLLLVAAFFHSRPASSSLSREQRQS